MPTTDAPIEIAEHDPLWKQEFVQMRSCLRDAAQGRFARIEHIGATAIDDQPARPTIDMLAVVAPGLTFDEIDWCVTGLNYRQVDEDHESLRRFVRPRFGAPTHRLFVALPESPFIAEALAFRDWLIRNPTDAARYAELRRYAASLFAGDPVAYRRTKQGFYGHVLRLHEEAAALLAD